MRLTRPSGSFIKSLKEETVMRLSARRLNPANGLAPPVVLIECVPPAAGTCAKLGIAGWKPLIDKLQVDTE